MTSAETRQRNLCPVTVGCVFTKASIMCRMCHYYGISSWSLWGTYFVLGTFIHWEPQRIISRNNQVFSIVMLQFQMTWAHSPVFFKSPLDCSLWMFTRCQHNKYHSDTSLFREYWHSLQMQFSLDIFYCRSCLSIWNLPMQKRWIWKALYWRTPWKEPEETLGILESLPDPAGIGTSHQCLCLEVEASNAPPEERAPWLLRCMGWKNAETTQWRLTWPGSSSCHCSRKPLLVNKLTSWKGRCQPSPFLPSLWGLWWWPSPTWRLNCIQPLLITPASLSDHLQRLFGFLKTSLIACPSLSAGSHSQA